MKGFLGITLGFILVSCSLSTEQEMELNHSLNNMIQARNDGDGLSYLNFTHPAIVKHYKDKGDSILKKKFQEIPKRSERGHFENDSLIYWGTGYVKEVRNQDSVIQARIEIQLYKNHELLDSNAVFYATSFENETDWIFANSNDYFSSVFPVEHRLFDHDK